MSHCSSQDLQSPTNSGNFIQIIVQFLFQFIIRIASFKLVSSSLFPFGSSGRSTAILSLLSRSLGFSKSGFYTLSRGISCLTSFLTIVLLLQVTRKDLGVLCIPFGLLVELEGRAEDTLIQATDIFGSIGSTRVVAFGFVECELSVGDAVCRALEKVHDQSGLSVGAASTGIHRSALPVLSRCS